MQDNKNTVMISPKELAARWGVSEGHLANTRSDGSSPIPYLRIGGVVRYELGEVESFEAASRIVPERVA